MSKKQINLLTDAEVSDLYSIPIFSDNNERDHFFTLSDAEHKLLEKYTSIKSKVYLIIQIGYFKAIQQFYRFSLDDVKDDVNFIIKKHYSSEENLKSCQASLFAFLNDRVSSKKNVEQNKISKHEALHSSHIVQLGLQFPGY